MLNCRWLPLLAIAGFASGCVLPKYDTDPTLAQSMGGGAGAAMAGGPAVGGSNGQPGGSGSSTGGSVSCPDEDTGAAGKPSTAGASTAIVLFDDIVIYDSTKTKILFQWQFADANTIADTATDPRPADKWSRTQFFGDVNKVSRATGAHSTFLACDGNPAAGSLKNVIPFVAPSQYYETSVLFAPHDYSNDQVTAKVKLVSGGGEDVTCPAHALIYGIAASTETPDAPITMSTGVWQDLSLAIPATGFTMLDELGIRITTYPCL
jgi:hypothetical protein